MATPMTREQIAQRIAQEVMPGYCVNLGIGIPTLVANYIPVEKMLCCRVKMVFRYGGFPSEKRCRPGFNQRRKQTVTAVKGASFFSSADSFAMIRGGHVNLTVLGAMQVDEHGDIANWMIPGKLVKGMGGAMILSLARDE